jgi:hypothetical protein
MPDLSVEKLMRTDTAFGCDTEIGVKRHLGSGARRITAHPATWKAESEGNHEL